MYKIWKILKALTGFERVAIQRYSDLRFVYFRTIYVNILKEFKYIYAGWQIKKK